MLFSFFWQKQTITVLEQQSPYEAWRSKTWSVGYRFMLSSLVGIGLLLQTNSAVCLSVRLDWLITAAGASMVSQGNHTATGKVISLWSNRQQIHYGCKIEKASTTKALLRKPATQNNDWICTFTNSFGSLCRFFLIVEAFVLAARCHSQQVSLLTFVLPSLVILHLYVL